MQFSVHRGVVTKWWLHIIYCHASIIFISCLLQQSPLFSSEFPSLNSLFFFAAIFGNVGTVSVLDDSFNNAVNSTPGLAASTAARSGSERVRDVAGEVACGSTELLIFARDRRRLNNRNKTAVGARTKIVMTKTAKAKQVYTLMLSN